MSNCLPLYFSFDEWRLSNQGFLQGIPSSKKVTHQLFLHILPYQLYQPGGGYWAHWNMFRNIPRTWWGPQAYSSEPPANLSYIWQNWESHLNSHNEMRIIKLHELFQYLQKLEWLNWSHEHLFMNRLWTFSAKANLSF